MDYENDEFISSMKEALPEYVVNCFVVAGFDTESVVAQMNTSVGPDNGIDEIEAFILKHFPDDSSYRHLSNTTSFVFSPGHKIRIINFIEKMK